MFQASQLCCYFHVVIMHVVMYAPAFVYPGYGAAMFWPDAEETCEVLEGECTGLEGD